ncbi:MAG: hypothetical protein ABSF79_10405 [Smithellaceae bacterium]
MKKMTSVLIFFILISCTSAYAQSTAPTQEIIINQIKKAVVFLQTDWEDSTTPNISNAKKQPLTKSTIGTGFLIFVSIPELGKDATGYQQGYIFLVTAKHMIRQSTPDHKPGPYAKNVTVFFNKIESNHPSGQLRDQSNIEIIDSRGDLRWFVDRSDPVADVALHWLSINTNSVDFKTIAQDLFATKSIVSEKYVNENDEVLFSGFFGGFAGSKKNYPIVRHGHLALLPGEDVLVDDKRPDKKTQIYLAEVTSFGGNSGSPVFLRLGGVRESTEVKYEGYTYLLLGVMSAYYPDKETKQNSGIALVVPADKINDILASDLVKALFASAIASDKTAKGDLKAAEAKFKESIDILERQAPESSQLVETIETYANMLEIAKRSDESHMMRTKAQKIKSQPVSKAPIP